MSRKKLVVIVATTLLVMMLGQFAGIHKFVAGGDPEKGNKLVLGLLGEQKEDDPLLAQIRAEADKRRIEPIDAVNDRVWKAVPGYNGREVDIDKTYEKAKAAGPGQKLEFVYRELKPKVSLDDLGAVPIFRGNPNKTMAAFMINVAWGNEYIIPMLDTLDEANVKATFFFDGSWLKKNTNLALEIQKRGHQLENHAYSHPNMSQLDDSRARLEISKTKDLLKEKLGVENRWFAPPSGDYNQRTVDLAAEQGLKTVLWTVDTVDWQKPAASTIIQKIAQKVEPGSLILMHPTASSRDALKGMIQVIERKGIKLGTVAETLSSERIDTPGVER